MSVLQVGRLGLGGPAGGLVEPMGDPAGSLGGAIVAAARVVPQLQVALATYVSQTTTLAERQTLRRQLRSLLNNTELKLEAFLYVAYADDEEQNGWYVPDAATLTASDDAAWKTQGLWQTAQGNWLLAGRRGTHREARQVWMKDLRTGLYERDTLEWLRSTDFSALPALELTVLPNGATSATVSVSGQVVAGAPLPTGRDGGECSLVEGLADLTVLAFERAEGELNLSDVVVYDRRGQKTAPAAGPDTGWEEVYGPDYPWSWIS